MEPRRGGRLRRRSFGGRGGGGRRRIALPRDRASDGIQSQLERGDAGIEPVAVGIERLDRRREPPRLALALPRHKLDLLRLSRQIGGCNLVAPKRQRVLVGHDGDDHGADRANAPGAQPPQRAAIEFVLLRQKTGQQAARGFRVQIASQMVRMFGQSLVGPPQGPNHATNINRICAGGLTSGRERNANRFLLLGKTTKDGPARSAAKLL